MHGGDTSLLQTLGLWHLRDFPTLRDHRIHLLMLGKPLSGALHQPQRLELDDEGRELCKRLDVDNAMHHWWEWLPRRKHWMLEQEEFRMLNRLCFEELAPTLPHYGDMYDEIAEAAGATDWDCLSKGEKALSYPVFVQAMLELAGNFHHSSDGAEYAAWLQEMHDRVRRRYDVDAVKWGRIYIWGSADDANGGTGQPTQQRQETKFSTVDQGRAAVSLPSFSSGTGLSSSSSEAHAPKKERNKHAHNHHPKGTVHRQRALKAWDGRKHEAWEYGRDDETIQANAGIKGRLLRTEHDAIPGSPIEGWTDTKYPADATLQEGAQGRSVDAEFVQENADGLEFPVELGLEAPARLRPEAPAVRQVGGGGFVTHDAKSKELHRQPRATAGSRGVFSASARPQSALSAASTVARSRPQSALELNGLQGTKVAGDDVRGAKARQRPRTALGQRAHGRHNVRTSESILSCKNSLPLRKMERSASTSSSASDVHYGISTVQFLTNEGVLVDDVVLADNQAISPEGSLRSAIRPLSANFSVRVQRTTRVRHSRPPPRPFSPSDARLGLLGFASPLSASLKTLSKDSVTDAAWQHQICQVSDTWDQPASHDVPEAGHAIRAHAQQLLQNRHGPMPDPPSLSLQTADDLSQASPHDIRILYGTGSEMPLPQEPSKHDLRPLDDGTRAREQLAELLCVRRVYGKHTSASDAPPGHLEPDDTSIILDLDLLGGGEIAAEATLLGLPPAGTDRGGNVES